MIGMEHQKLNNDIHTEFREAYHSLRLELRLKRRKAIPPKYRPPVQDSRKHLTCREAIQKAVLYAQNSWALAKWPDPIVGQAKRKLAQSKQAKIRTDEKNRIQLGIEQLTGEDCVTDEQKMAIITKVMK